MTKVSLGFKLEPLTVPVDKILPSRKTPMGVTTSRKFMQIRSSIEEIGLIEPLSVGAADPKTGQHILLDGHIRLIALRELNYGEVQCLVATDDERSMDKPKVRKPRVAGSWQDSTLNEGDD